MGNPAPPRVLELRIHGVNNTSPAAMLDRPAYHVEQRAGDHLGSFWQVTPHLLGERGPGERGYLPPAIHREAYSWGGMARSSPGLRGTGVNSVAANIVGRVTWALLLPFGLANVAYWSRELPQGDRWRGSFGAAATRVFGLGLTVLLVLTTCAVALDLFAVQCYPADRQVCLDPPRWLAALDLLDGTGVGTRLAVASAVPAALLALLWFLAWRSQVRYETYGEAAAPTGAPDSGRMLARRGLWCGGPMVRELAVLHVVAGLLTVTLASAWPAAVGSGTACRRPLALAHPDCWAQIGALPGAQSAVFGTVVAAAAAVFVATAIRTGRRSDDAPDTPEPRPGRSRRGGVGLLAVAAVLLVGNAALLIGMQPEVRAPASLPAALPGVGAAPAILVAVLVGIALSGLAWRSNRRWSAVLGVVATTGLFLAGYHPLWGVLVVPAAAGGLVALAATAGPDRRRAAAWGGTGPGLLMGLSLLVATTLSALVVVGVGNWLNGGAGAADLLGCEGGPAPDLCVPPAYVWFATGSAAAAAGVGALMLVLVVQTLVNRRRRVPLPTDGPPVEPPVLAGRHWAALAHRAEPVAGVLGALGLATSAVAVVASVLPPGTLPESAVEVVANLALGGTALAVLALVATFVGGGAAVRTRPLGLVWDLICFLPRAAHPFAPPCYAERAVPEIVDRCRSWLDGGRGHRAVVLSAHSLGAVLAVAVLFALDADRRRSVHLITYGTQLRTYFGRVFPELLGPEVLGTPAARRASLRRVDPWYAQLRPGPPPAVPPDSLRSLLAAPDRWVSLWRRTDYLGFPVHGYPPHGPVDRVAEEYTDGRVMTHGDYPRSRAYLRALDEAVAASAPAVAPFAPPDARSSGH